MAANSNVTPLHAGVHPSGSAVVTQPTTPRLRNTRRGEPPEPVATAALRDARNPSWPFGEMPAEEIADLMQVGIHTARRWRQTRKLTGAAKLLGHILISGDLGAINARWNGWLLYRGELYGPSVGRPFTASELSQHIIATQRVAALEATVRRLENERQIYMDKRALTQRHSEALRAIGYAEALTQLAFTALNQIKEDGSPCLAASAEARTLAESAVALTCKLYSQRNPETGAPYGPPDSTDS